MSNKTHFVFQILSELPLTEQTAENSKNNSSETNSNTDVNVHKNHHEKKLSETKSLDDIKGTSTQQEENNEKS